MDLTINLLINDNNFHSLTFFSPFTLKISINHPIFKLKRTKIISILPFFNINILM
jgi:hypothetical protein